MMRQPGVGYRLSILHACYRAELRQQLGRRSSALSTRAQMSLPGRLRPPLPAMDFSPPVPH